MTERECIVEFIDAAQQALLDVWIDVEAVNCSDWRRHRLIRQVDRQARARKFRENGQQPVNIGLRKNDRQEAVLQRVAIEDVAEAWCDHRPKAVVPQRIDRAFPGRSAAKIAAGNQNMRRRGCGSVQDEIRLRCAVAFEAQIAKQEIRVALLARFLQEPRRDDLIGIDIGQCERRRHRLEAHERGHDALAASILRTSVKRPAMAAAAAIAGLARCVRALGP